MLPPHLLSLALVASLLLAGACTSPRPVETARERPPADEVARQAAQSAGEADEDLVLYSSSMDDQQADAQPNDEQSEGEQPADQQSDGQQANEGPPADEDDDTVEADGAGDDEEAIDSPEEPQEQEEPQEEPREN